MPVDGASSKQKKKGPTLPPKPALYTDAEWELAHSVPRLLEFLSVVDKGSAGKEHKDKPLATRQAVRSRSLLCTPGSHSSCAATCRHLNSVCPTHQVEGAEALCLAAQAVERLSGRITILTIASCCGWRHAGCLVAVAAAGGQP